MADQKFRKSFQLWLTRERLHIDTLAKQIAADEKMLKLDRQRLAIEKKRLQTTLKEYKDVI